MLEKIPKKVATLLLVAFLVTNIGPAIKIAKAGLTLTVDTQSDAADAGDCGTLVFGDLPGADAKISIREAICVANNTAGSDTIDFDASISNKPITLSGGDLPSITEVVIIDGDGDTVLNGNGNNEVVIASDNGTIKGIEFYNFSGNQLRISGDQNTIGGPDSTDRNYFYQGATTCSNSIKLEGTQNTIKNNYIGFNKDLEAIGCEAVGGSGITITGTGNTVGGTLATDANVIVDHAKAGIILAAGSSNTNIQGNFIGLDPTGSTGSGTASYGIYLLSAADLTDITIGGVASGAGNTISGHSDAGIYTALTSGGANTVIIQGNKIGLNSAGTAKVSSTGDGIGIKNATGVITIGEDSSNGRNIISGHTLSGIDINAASAADINISGNYIGTDAGGHWDFGNGTAGITIGAIASGTITIGDSTSATSTNVISGNNTSGISATGDFSIYSSAIGTNASGTGAIANGTYGIYINGSTFTVGSGNLTTGFNVVSGNTGTGVFVTGSTAAGPISGNLVGTNLLGTSALANGMVGMEMVSTATGVIIGSSSASSATNVISGNTEYGMTVNSASGLEIYSSYIGTNKEGTGAVANSRDAIYLTDSTDTTIGNTSTAGFNILGGSGINNGINVNTVILVDTMTIKGNYIGTDTTGTASFGFTTGIAAADGRNLTIGSTTTGEGNVIANNATGIKSNTGILGNLWRGNNLHDNTVDIDITTPGTIEVSGTSIGTATTSEAIGLSDLADGTIIDIYSRPSTSGAMTWEGETTVSGGAWSLRKDFSASGGDYYAIIATDASSNSSEIGTQSVVTADITAPADITITSSTDDTNEASYTFTGTKEEYASVEADGSGWIAKSDSNATWSYPVTLTEGANTFAIASEDYSYNRSATGTVTITLDTAAPSAPSLSHSANASVTSAVITVSGEANASVYLDGSDTGTDIDAGSGTASITVSVTVGETNTYNFTLLDSAGNLSEPSSTSIVPVYGGGGGSGGGGGGSSSSVSPLETEVVEPEEEFDAEIPEETEEITEEPIEEIEESAVESKETQPAPVQPQTYYPSAPEAEVEPTVSEDDITEPEEPLLGIDDLDIEESDIPKAREEDLDIVEILTEKILEKIEELTNLKQYAKEIAEIFEEIMQDKDLDGISDLWEEENLGDIDIDAEADTDNDGLTNLQEYEAGSDPLSADTDNDNISDAAEIALGLDSLSWDSDGDGISDYQEITEKTDPLTPEPIEINEAIYGEDTDSDGDGLSDYIEAKFGTDPERPDTDGDGLTDAEEVADYDSNPNKIDDMREITPKITNIPVSSFSSGTDILMKGIADPGSTVVIYILDENGNPVAVLNEVVDEKGKFAVFMEENLPDGNYRVLVVSVIGKKTQNISVLNKFTVDTSQTGAGVEVIGLAQTGEKPRVTALASPGSTVYITWKSLIFSSVVIADTETGELTAEVPGELEEGDHTVYLYSVDEKKGIASQTTKVNFTVAGEGLMHSSAAIQESQQKKFPYEALIFMSIMGFAGAYVFYKKSGKSIEEERKLIEKL
ncbi:MAG: hypothetical protein ABII07_02760 [Patescibacteria group bacterium]|nr:hypothetical protein [Patescibacteria group bacterium]